MSACARITQASSRFATPRKGPCPSVSASVSCKASVQHHAERAIKHVACRAAPCAAAAYKYEKCVARGLHAARQYLVWLKPKRTVMLSSDKGAACSSRCCCTRRKSSTGVRGLKKAARSMLRSRR